MKKVVSSHLSSIHYDPKTKVLEITFNQGAVYHYHGVSQASYNNLENAKSHGQHFDKYIKDKYTTKKK